MAAMHPRDQLRIIVSSPPENWKQVDIYGLMYALGVSLPSEKEDEIRNEFINRFMPWRHLMILMAEDVLCDDTPEMTHYREVLSFYRSELYRLYPEIFLVAARRLERSKGYYRVEPQPPPSHVNGEDDESLHENENTSSGKMELPADDVVREIAPSGL